MVFLLPLVIFRWLTLKKRKTISIQTFVSSLNFFRFFVLNILFHCLASHRWADCCEKYIEIFWAMRTLCTLSRKILSDAMWATKENAFCFLLLNVEISAAVLSKYYNGREEYKTTEGNIWIFTHYFFSWYKCVRSYFDNFSFFPIFFLK